MDGGIRSKPARRGIKGNLQEKGGLVMLKTSGKEWPGLRDHQSPVYAETARQSTNSNLGVLEEGAGYYKGQ